MTSLDISASWVLIGTLVVLLGAGFVGAPLIVTTAVVAACLFLLHASTGIWIAFAIVAVIFNLPPIRQLVISTALFSLMKKMGFMPKISETERVALTAGDVWIERELFSGKPNFKRILEQPYPTVNAEEQAFVDNQVEKLCSMVTDWEIWRRRDLPPEVWEYMKKEKFFGMIIPREYGGLGFTALGHSEVIHKLASRSLVLAVTAMVPNSLGPAELLNHYGTDEQKKYYLPRLARGEEMPCFALTEPNAGSDAASIQASGELFKGDDGKLYIKLNWNKRWITLAAISTVLGLAFRLRDPKNLLGKGEDLGITCALIPTETAGVTANRRHDPLGVPFYNCPTQGKDVVVPVDAIIGGLEQAGNGWKMLMESLGAGRGISLPAQCTGGLKTLTYLLSAFATVRKQFGMSVGRFEGVAEKVAQVAGYTYLCEAARRYTCGALDQGIKPPVVTAVMKYFTTELARKACIDGMDVLGGSGITRGPHNLIAHYYIACPIQITVEGANILTRTLMIFGQGALRAHPYAFKEVDALEKGDVGAFDRAFWAHMGHVARNKIRWLLLSATRGWLSIPAHGGVTAKYYRKLNWTSAAFAFFADVEMASLGGALKAKGKITGRMADVLGWMYLATATLRRFEAEGRKKEDEPFLVWSLETAFFEIQKAFDGIYGSIELPYVAWIFRGPIRWLHALNPIGRPVDDALDLKIAAQIQRPSEQRTRFTSGIFIPKDASEQFVKLERAFELTVASEDAAHKVKRAVRKGKLKKKAAAELYADAVAAGIITQAEFDSVEKAEKARWETIQVDDWGLQEYLHHYQDGGAPSMGGGFGGSTPSSPRPPAAASGARTS